MAQYKCKNLGECNRANSGEVFEIAVGEDLKCPDCGVGSMLEIVNTPTASAGRSKVPLIVGGAVAAILLAGGGYYFTAGNKKSLEPQLPTETIVIPATVPAAGSLPVTSASESTPTIATTGIAPTEAETKALRQESENKLTSGDAASAEQASNKAAANEMLKSAIAKMAQSKLEEAEADLFAARERDPTQSLVSYNLAVLRLKQGRKDEALKEFEASFKAGFSYFDQMDKDADLDILRKDPSFNKLVTSYRNQSLGK